MKILVIEDEKLLADSIQALLTKKGFEVEVAYDGETGKEYAELGIYDLLILDVMMPKMNGWDVCREIRETSKVPIIMLTAKDEEIDKITGLAMGADDYITKPFRPLEMVARVKAQLRRYKRYNSPKEDKVDCEMIVHSGLVMNIKTHVCTLNEKPLELTPTEFEILRILLEHKGEVISAEKLFHEIWQDTYFSKSNNTITVHIRHLREKMNDTMDQQKYIKTVWGVGYKIEK